jgi:hypothetical protein
VNQAFFQDKASIDSIPMSDALIAQPTITIVIPRAFAACDNHSIRSKHCITSSARYLKLIHPSGNLIRQFHPSTAAHPNFVALGSFTVISSKFSLQTAAPVPITSRDPCDREKKRKERVQRGEFWHANPIPAAILLQGSRNGRTRHNIARPQPAGPANSGVIR